MRTWKAFGWFTLGLILPALLTVKLWKRKRFPVRPEITAVLVAMLLSGCAALYGTKATPEDVRALLEIQNARGCLFFRGAATPWADVNLWVVGTWGNDPPPYAQCWESLPR